jgi:hypothetical protein
MAESICIPSIVIFPAMIFPARISEYIFFYTDSTHLDKVRTEEFIPYSMIFSARTAESIFLYTDVTYLDKVRSPSHSP